MASSNKLKLKKKITNLNLTDWKRDLADWIMELKKIQTQLDRMRHVISDENLMIHILTNLPEEYKSKVKALENDMDNEDDPLTLDLILVELDAKYEKIWKKNNKDQENKDSKKGRRRYNNHDKALAESENYVFKGRFYVCGNWGHKSNQYPFRNNGNTQNGQNKQNIQNTNNSTNANCNAIPTNNSTAHNTNNYILPYAEIGATL